MARQTVLVTLTLITCLISSASRLGAQSLTDSSDMQQQEEDLFDQIEGENEQSELVDRLTWLEEHPFDLNTVSREELATVPRLTNREVNAILSLRQRLKSFSSVAQLGEIEDVGEQILKKCSRYVIVERGDDGFSGTSFSLTSRVSRDLQPRRGFQDSIFTGSPLKSYNRFTMIQGGSLQAGALFEKDAGEQFGNGFVSGYVAVCNLSFLSQAILGDYVVESGQGLVLWRASAFGKSSEATMVARKSSLGGQPYRSADEFNFMRGIALATKLPVGGHSVTIEAFYSRRLLSASASDTTITGFYEEGLYRSESELGKRSNVAEQFIGSRIRFQSASDYSIGATFYRSQFSKPTVADRIFEFEGSTARVWSVDGAMNLGMFGGSLAAVSCFGEFAHSGGGTAALIGTSFNIFRGTDLVFLYRDYQPQFVSLHATGFGERSDTRNERGFYVGADFAISNAMRLSGYLDHFRFPWRTFDNPLPTSGRDMLVQIEMNPARTIELVVRYANKNSETIMPSLDEQSRETRVLVDRNQEKLRLTASLRVNARMRLRSRIERTNVGYAALGRNETGLLLYQEVQYSLPPKLSAEVRLVFFDTDSYDSRVYEYENDLRGVFSNPALYGKGRRWYALLRWKAASFMNVSFKYAETQFDGLKAIGSGTTEIQGDRDNRLSFQFDIRM